jgi:dihydrolipoamide dehydrogenase
MKSVDVAIIGAGTAGLSAERVARGAGASTVLIDEHFQGTTCATVGCMPSKLLIAAAAAAHAVRRASTFGVFATHRIDAAAVMARLRQQRDSFAAVTREQIAQLPRGVALRGKAKFVGTTTLELSGAERVQARAVVIATGSHPAIPESFAAIRNCILTNENLFELAELPESLAVVGAGPLGLELAQAMARLGVAVSLFDEKAAPGGVEDAALAACMREAFATELDLHLGVRIQVAAAGDRASIRWEGDSSGARIFDRVLVAAGRPPNLAGLNLAAAGLALDERGIPVFDCETLQCGDSPVFIAGDANADRPVLHEAQVEGSTAGFNAARFPGETQRRRSVPFSIMFTDPPLALIGQHSGRGLVCGETDYRDQGRAKVEARARGLLEIYATEQGGVLKGAALFCPGADHLGHLLCWAINAGATAAALLEQPFYHPTLEEGLKPALRQICERAKVQLSPMEDLGSPSGA